MRPAPAVRTAGPHPHIHTVKATAPRIVAYGASGPTSGIRNQRIATAAAAITRAFKYLTESDI
jgi:hypothetical protein